MKCSSTHHAELIRMMIRTGKFAVTCETCGARITRGLPADFKEVRERMKKDENNETRSKQKTVKLRKPEEDPKQD